MDAVYDELLREILHVGSTISLLRSTSENLQDYVPFLCYVPENEKKMHLKQLRECCDAYLNLLLEKVCDMIWRGTNKPCISVAILKNDEIKLMREEVSLVYLLLKLGGFEMVPATLTSTIGLLLTVERQVWQDCV